MPLEQPRSRRTRRLAKPNHVLSALRQAVLLATFVLISLLAAVALADAPAQTQPAPPSPPGDSSKQDLPDHPPGSQRPAAPIYAGASLPQQAQSSQSLLAGLHLAQADDGSPIPPATAPGHANDDQSPDAAATQAATQAGGEHEHAPAPTQQAHEDEHQLRGHVHHEGPPQRQAVSTLDRAIVWLGRFHPPMVNFPIGLLVAAAVAELLLMATGKHSLNAAVRYCVWFGALAAGLAVILGWFFAGFQLRDDDAILTVHRWLGTGMGLLALLTLVLCELAYRRPGASARHRFRFFLFLSALWVLVTGFFGGAMIFGLNYYQWPS